MPRRWKWCTSLAATALVTGLTPAIAAAPPHRTYALSTDGDGALLAAGAGDAAIAGSSSVVAFTTSGNGFVAGTPGAIADVVTINVFNGTRRRVSETPSGVAADGPSFNPAISSSGDTVAFTSLADNLVASDTNGVADIFARSGTGPVVRVSVATDGGQANGPSSQPDISADGRWIVFTSSASNLVPGDTNGEPDVFIHDLRDGTTTRVSVSDAGAQGAGRSSAPAVDADGSAVAFESAAPDLVRGDINGVADVFERDLRDGRTHLVSVSTDGRQQDKAVSPPYTMEPDISRDGRYVVFDTDATTLYPQDRNRRTDVYLRDVLKAKTTLISASTFNVQGNNDSVTPRITPNGRFITFQSFATNLVPDDGPRADLFIRDRRNSTTALINATDGGAVRQPEPGAQILQHAPVSDDGRVAVFASAASGIVAGPPSPSSEVYLRLLTPPRPRLVSKQRRAGGGLRVTVTADDAHARLFVCQVDRATPYKCGTRINLKPRVGRILRVRAGGSGMLWSSAITISLVSGRIVP